MISALAAASSARPWWSPGKASDSTRLLADGIIRVEGDSALLGRFVETFRV